METIWIVIDQTHQLGDQRENFSAMRDIKNSLPTSMFQDGFTNISWLHVETNLSTNIETIEKKNIKTNLMKYFIKKVNIFFSKKTGDYCC